MWKKWLIRFRKNKSLYILAKARGPCLCKKIMDDKLQKFPCEKLSMVLNKGVRILSYIILHTTNEKVRIRLSKLRKVHSDLFVLEMGGETFVMRNNGVTLSYIAYLLNRYPNEIYVWVADRLTLRQFPKRCVKAGKWFGRGRKLLNVPNYLGISKEELKKCKINYSVNLSE